MFDFLNKAETNPFLQSPGGQGGPAPAKRPPPAAKPPTGDAGADQAPDGALSNLFAGMTDGGDAAPVSSLAAPAQTAEPPPTSHELNPIGHPLKPMFDTPNEIDLLGDANAKNMAEAARSFDYELYFFEGNDIERKHNRDNQAKRRAIEDRMDGETDEQRSALKIGASDRALAIDADTPVKDIESPEGRIKTLNMLTQNRDPNDDRFKNQAAKPGDPNYRNPNEGDVDCGAATIVGGILYSEGRKGLSTLLAATTKPGDKPDPEVEALKEKLAKPGEPLTLGDLQELQSQVYHKLKDLDGTDPKTLQDQLNSKDPKEKAKAFATSDSIQKFMTEMVDTGDGRKESLIAMFKEKNLDFSTIDTEGTGEPNHCILRIADEKDHAVAYYDPWMKKGNVGQIINAKDGNPEGLAGTNDPSMEDYKNAGAEEHRTHLARGD
jgi:hypothetical protein